jgi:uncharacterized tellurite resistance protein B-like protein
MIESLKSLFSAKLTDSNANSTPNTHEDRLKVATCVILLEIARADDDFTLEERQSVVKALSKRFSLSETDAHELIDFATNEREESRDLWTFTNHINQSCNRAEKLEIIDEVWRVVIADGSIDGHERNLAYQLAKLLHINHEQLIVSKMKILDNARKSK